MIRSPLIASLLLLLSLPTLAACELGEDGAPDELEELDDGGADELDPIAVSNGACPASYRSRLAHRPIRNDHGTVLGYVDIWYSRSLGRVCGLNRAAAATAGKERLRGISVTYGTAIGDPDDAGYFTSYAGPVFARPRRTSICGDGRLAAFDAYIGHNYGGASACTR